MSVTNGQQATETTFNDAFVSKTQDSEVISNIDLNDPDASQGLQITQTQREINSVNSFIGKTVNTAKDVKPTWVNNDVGAPTDDLKVRADNLTAEAADVRAAQGTAIGDTDLGVFTGSVISDSNTVKGALQELETEVELKEDFANKGQPNGYASLDGTGRIPSAQLPSSAFEYLGNWNASTNTPTLADGVGDAGDTYRVSVAGSQDLGSGSISFLVGDKVVYNTSGVWEKWDVSDEVTSVNGESGAVVLDLDDINDVDTTGVSGRDFLRRNDGNTAWEDFNLDSSADDATTGSNVTLASVATSVVRLTSGTLASVDMVPAGFSGQKFILVNATGVTVDINNDTGATAANRILTGTGVLIELDPDANLWFLYDSTTSRWRVVGGSGAGGSINGPVSSTDNAVVRWDGTGADTVQDSGVTIDDSDNVLTPGTLRAQGGFTDGTNTTAESVITSLRTLNTSVQDERVPRYDSGTGAWVNRVSQAKVGLLTGSSKDFEVDTGLWAGYDDGATAIPVDGTGGTFDSTFARDTVEFLNGDASLRFSKDANDRQGEGISISTAIDKKFRGQLVSLKFSYRATVNFDYGNPFDVADPSDITVYFYDQTNSKVITPSPYNLFGDGKYEGMFQIPSDCTNGRIILHIATTNALAWDFFVDDIDIELASTVVLSEISAWQQYTPTFLGFGTVSTQTFWYRRVGADIEVIGRFVPGTTTATPGTVGLPAGLQFWNNWAANNNAVGILYTGNNNAGHYGVVAANNDTGVRLTISNSSNGAINNINANAIFAAGQNLTVKFSGPISGWSSANLLAPSVNLNAPAVTSAYKNGGSITANTVIASWTAKTKDSVNGFDLSSGVYTVKTPGDYLVIFNLATTNTGADTTAVPDIYVNGSLYQEGVPSEGVANDGNCIAMIPDLKYGDTIDFRCQQTRTLESVNTGTSISITKIELNGRVYSPRVCYIKDVKTSGTAGGTFTSGAYQTRTLNTLEGDQSFVTLSSNQFTLQPGSYKIKASAPAGYLDSHKAKLRNITDSTDTIIGTANYQAVSASSFGAFAVVPSVIVGSFSISSAKTFEIQHRCQTTRPTDGFGVAASFGDSEVYTTVEIEKVL